MKELRATLLLAAVLGLALLLWRSLLPPSSPPAFPFASAPDLCILELENGKGSVHLTREEGRWRLSAPKRPCDPIAVEALLGPLAAYRGPSVTERSEAIHGLGRPLARLRWTRCASTAPLDPESASSIDAPRPIASGELLVGAAIPSEDGRYVSTGPASAVWVLPLEAVAPLLGAPSTFRSLIPCPVTTAEIDRVEIRDRRLTRQLRRRAREDWLVESPFFARARPGPVQELLCALPSLRASEVATECPGPDLSPWGLDRPNVRLRAWNATGKEILALDLGHRLPRRGERVWIRSSLDPAVFVCPAERLMFLADEVHRLHPGDLLAVPSESVRRLELEMDGRLWAWTSGQASAEEERRARRLLSRLAELPVIRVIDAAGMTDETLGLDRPRGRLRIAGEGFDHRHVVGRAAGEWLHLRLDGIVLRLPVACLDELARVPN